MRRKFYTVLRENAKALSIVPENTRIVPLQPDGDPPIFFMVDSYPYFIDMVQLMGTAHPVLSLIGQEETQTTESYSIHDEAAAHVNTILGQQPRGPYVLGGCSASGIVAYEIAQQLQRLGHEIGLLVLFDTANPYFIGEYSAWRRSLVSFQTDLSHMRWGEIPFWIATKAAGRIAKITSWLRRVTGLGPQGSSLEQFGPLEVRIAASRMYRPAPLSGSLLLVRRSHDQLAGRYLDPHYGWGEVVRGNLEVCVVSGADHLDIFKDEADRVAVASPLRRHLDWIASHRSQDCA